MYTRDRAPTPDEVKAHAEAHGDDEGDARWLFDCTVYFVGRTCALEALGRPEKATPLALDGRPVPWPTPPEGFQRVELVVGVTEDPKVYAAKDAHGEDWPESYDGWGQVADDLHGSEWQPRRVVAWVRKYDVPTVEGVEVSDG